MINQLCIEDGDIIEVKNATLQLATFSKFQPQTTDFLDITNPKAVYQCVHARVTWACTLYGVNMEVARAYWYSNMLQWWWVRGDYEVHSWMELG